MPHPRHPRVWWGVRELGLSLREQRHSVWRTGYAQKPAISPENERTLHCYVAPRLHASLHSLPGVFLLLQRPEIVGDPMDVFIRQDAFPWRHVQRGGRLFRILDGRHFAVLDNPGHLLFGVVVRGVKKGGNLAALTVGIGHSSLEFQAVTAYASESGETLLAGLDRGILRRQRPGPLRKDGLRIFGGGGGHESDDGL